MERMICDRQYRLQDPPSLSKNQAHKYMKVAGEMMAKKVSRTDLIFWLLV